METNFKKCGKCGWEHYTIPANAKLMQTGEYTDGYWWDCACRSTLFLPLAKAAPLLNNAEQKGDKK